MLEGTGGAGEQHHAFGTEQESALPEQRVLWEGNKLLSDVFFWSELMISVPVHLPFSILFHFGSARSMGGRVKRLELE